MQLNTTTRLPAPFLNEMQNFEISPVKGGNVLKLIGENDPRLHEVSIDYPFDTTTPEETDQLVLDLSATMRAERGIGLSAVQVGIMYKVIVLEIGGELPLAIFNPKVVDFGQEAIYSEGCLSYKSLILDIERPQYIRIRFQTNSGETVTRKFEGLSARCVSHELDHLNGVTFTQHVSKLKLDLADRKRKKHLRK